MMTRILSTCQDCRQRIELLGGAWTDPDGCTCCTANAIPAYTPHRPHWITSGEPLPPPGLVPQACGCCADLTGAHNNKPCTVCGHYTDE